MATGVDWTNHSGKTSYGASAICDVLIIASESVSQPSPDVVKRRPSKELTEELRVKLENQGIVAREDQKDDLSLVKARFLLSHSRYTITGVEVNDPMKGRLTSDVVMKKIMAVMNNCADTRGGNTQF